MGLEIIMERLTSGYYRHANAVVHDISTIASNAVQFNRAGTSIAVAAQGKHSVPLTALHLLILILV
jgi:Bromodomain